MSKFTQSGKHLIPLLIAMSNVSLASVDLSSSANFTTSFEATEGYTSGFLSSDPNWILGTGSAPEVGSFAYTGQFGLNLDGFDTIRVDFSSSEAPSVGWVDLYLKPAFGEVDGLPVAFPLGQAALTGFVKVGLDGEIYVLHGNGSGDGVWLPTGYSVALDGNVSIDWLRMTYRLDYASQRWDLYLNDALQIVDLGFVDASAPPLSKFLLEGSLEGATYFDQFTAGFINPLFADADNDGIDDAYETTQGMDPLTNDRDSDLDRDSVINVLEFMDGLDAGDPDSDGDGVHDGAEILAGANPASADAYALESVPYVENFELYSEGDLTSQSFWQISGGNALVQSGNRFGGEQALELQVGESALKLQNSFDGSDHSQVWVDFRLQPVLFQDRWLDDIDQYLSDEIASAFFFIENHKVAILDGDGQGSGAWSVLSGVATEAGAWARVTIHQDYVSQEFKLWVNGLLLDGSYGFVNTQPYFNRLSIKQDNTDSAYLDDVYVSDQRPLGLDSDGDGLTDDTEDANGNGFVDPGESDPFLTDTDGDGFLDSDPVHLRLWLTADHGVQSDSNNLLTGWLDQSIYQDHASPESNLQAPVLVASSVHFDGVDDFLSGTSSFDANSNDLTLILVQRSATTSDAAAFTYLNTPLSSGSPLLTWSASDFFGFTGPEANQGLTHDLSGATSELTITALRRSGDQANGLNSELSLRSSSDLKSKESTGTQDWQSTVYQYSNELAAIIQEGPSLNNGTIDGSLQICQPDSFHFNGANINGDLLVLGNPQVNVNGNPNWDGIVAGDGATATSYQITLNSNATLRALKTFSDAVQFPTLDPVATPQGNRYVSLNNNSNDPGDFATIRNLTLNGNLGTVAVPAGVYGRFTANGNNSFVLGDPNSVAALVYEFEALTLNGNSTLTVLGPVVIRVKNNLSLNADIGESSTIDDLTLELPTANLTLNSNSTLYGTVLAPQGKVTLNGNSTLTGRLIAEELSLNGGDLVAAGTWPSNPAPDLGYLIGKTTPGAVASYSGEILEIRVYDQALEDDVLDQIHAQLVQKYGINDDFDNDGISNFTDDDLDGDGLLNSEEDLNANGIVDAGESDPSSTDTDGDGTLDAYDTLWTADPVADAASLQAQADGSLMTRFSFDAADGYTTGTLSGQQGWEAAPIFRVSANDSANSTGQSLTSLAVPYDSETETSENAFATARHYLDTSAASTVWVSFQAKLESAILSDIDLSSNPAVVLALSFPNYVSVYDSSLGEWLKAHDVVSPDSWTSYDLELDYTNKVWKLCIEGETIFESTPFVDPTHSSLEQFILLQQSGIGQDGWIDEIEISNVEPTGLDFDGDGLDNATERQLGTDVNSADTDGDGLGDALEVEYGFNPIDPTDGRSDGDADGLNNADEFQYGTDYLLPDTDGDQLSDYEEVMLGSDPLLDDSLSLLPLTGFQLDAIDAGLKGAAYQSTGDNPLYYLMASGVGVAEAQDSGHYLHRSVIGDFSFTVQLNYANEGVTPEFSLMLRESLDASSSMVALLRESNLRHFVVNQRGLEGEDSNFDYGKLNFQYVGDQTWMRLVREGDTLYSYASQNGVSWTLATTSQAPEDLSLELGVFASSGSLTEATYIGFTIAELLTDFDQDGIWDDEETGYGTSVTESDSDGDGYSDYEEIHDFYSDPTSADLESPITTVSVDGSAYISTVGEWIDDGVATYAVGGRGAVEFDLNVTEAAIYRLNILGQSRYNATGFDDYSIKVKVDGVYIGRIQMGGVLEGVDAYGRIVTPWLPVGLHRIEFFIDNTYTLRSLQVNSVSLEYIGGEDLNTNGTPDWMETRLSENNGIENASIDTITESAVSPFCLTGRSRYLAFAEAMDEELELGALPAYEFYTDVPLSAQADTSVAFDFENNGFSEAVDIRWVTTNILSTESITIRVGDSLRLVAYEGNAPSSDSVTIDFDGLAPSVEITADEPVEFRFDQAGSYEITAANGSVSSAMIVSVLEADFGEEALDLLVGTSFYWLPSALSETAEVSIDESVYIFETTNELEDTRKFDLNATDTEPGYAAARLPGNGAVLDSLALEPFRLASSSETRIEVVEYYDDGAALVEVDLVLTDLPPDVRVVVGIFVGGVTFADGSIESELLAEDFDELGRATLQFIMPFEAISSVCHRIYLYNGDQLLGQQ